MTFIAGQIPSSTPTAASFSGSYQMAYVNYPSPVDGSFYDAQFMLSPNGAGTASTSPMTGNYQEDSTGTLTPLAVSQAAASFKYTAANGAIVLNFPTFSTKNPASTALMTGQEYLYFSPDGNFVFGGSPSSPDMR